MLSVMVARPEVCAKKNPQGNPKAADFDEFMQHENPCGEV